MSRFDFQRKGGMNPAKHFSTHRYQNEYRGMTALCVCVRVHLALSVFWAVKSKQQEFYVHNDVAGKKSARTAKLKELTGAARRLGQAEGWRRRRGEQ